MNSKFPRLPVPDITRGAQTSARRQLPTATGSQSQAKRARTVAPTPLAATVAATATATTAATASTAVIATVAHENQSRCEILNILGDFILAGTETLADFCDVVSTQLLSTLYASVIGTELPEVFLRGMTACLVYTEKRLKERDVKNFVPRAPFVDILVAVDTPNGLGAAEYVFSLGVVSGVVSYTNTE